MRIADLNALATEDTQTNGNEEHLVAWALMVEELRNLGGTISACGVALETAEKDGEMKAREKWPWRNR